MTLSNFDWTDKDSVKWFVILPSGHEGPYSLEHLIESEKKKKISSGVKVWAEGITEPVSLAYVIGQLSTEIEDDDDAPPPLPPLPAEFADDYVAPTAPVEVPNTPSVEPTQAEESIEPEIKLEKKKLNPIFYWAPLVLIGLGISAYLYREVMGHFEVFDIRRYPKMTLELHQRIKKEFKFEGWDKKIFFKEYLPDDHSHIWLVTAGFQHCKVEASFQSMSEKLLSMKDEQVAFKTKGTLEDHVVEFSQFDFSQGSKIIPGLYEMDVTAHDCQWSGFLPRLMNLFQSPEEKYIGRTKVVLFSKGPKEFSEILDRLIKKKMEKHLKEQNKKELFWQDLQQKLETLQAITIQIEQLLLDFVGQDNKKFTSNLKPTVDRYTKQFGSFLTSFVVENEKYFKELDKEDLAGITQFKTYEVMVNHTSKRIGFESMKFIEEMQKLKKTPDTAYLKNLAERMKKTYGQLKIDIGQKIIQVSDDRSQ